MGRKTLTLFAGAGGADIGIRDAGFDHALGVEWDEHAAATARAAGFPVKTGDVRDATLYESLPPIDLLWASPPCQDWSTAGKREGASGDRNGWPWTWDVVDLLQSTDRGPRWLICENVTGMLQHSGKCKPQCTYDCAAHYWHEVVMREARKRFAWADWRVLNAADFGVPQHRRRVFLVAGPRPIEWPKSTHGDPAALAQGGLFSTAISPWVRCDTALDLSSVIGGGTRRGGWDGWSPRELAGGPSATVNAMFASSGGIFTPHAGGKPKPAGAPGPVASELRLLTVAECARLQDFPDGYPWHGPKAARYKQVGNAVPPTLARVLAEAVLKADGE